MPRFVVKHPQHRVHRNRFPVPLQTPWGAGLPGNTETRTSATSLPTSQFNAIAWPATPSVVFCLTPGRALNYVQWMNNFVLLKRSNSSRKMPPSNNSTRTTRTTEGIGWHRKLISLKEMKTITFIINPRETRPTSIPYKMTWSFSFK